MYSSQASTYAEASPIYLQKHEISFLSSPFFKAQVCWWYNDLGQSITYSDDVTDYLEGTNFRQKSL